MGNEIKLLLVQVRKEQEMADHEFSVIARTAELPEDSFDRINVVKGEKIELEKLKEYDAVIIGGSGGFSVLGGDSFNEHLKDITRYCKENNIPFLGLCYGFQIAVQALGGKVINDLSSMETGTFVAKRTDNSDNDPLIGTLPKEFPVACGRQDRAEILPEGVANYVSTEKCPYHYITFPGTNFFAAQFHPELWKREDNLVRITFYREKYGLSEEEYNKQTELFSDAPESAKILSNFMQNVVIANKR